MVGQKKILIKSLLVSYADDSTLLKIVPTKDLRLSAEIKADLCRIADWGKVWHIEFEPLKSIVYLLNVILRNIPLYL